jgi:hypothetical protein
MRLYEIIQENLIPSAKLLAAAKSWIKGWGLVIPRERIEQKILSVKNEAMRFIRTDTIMLYRGISPNALDASDKAWEEKLLNNETIILKMPKLASWTYYSYIAEDFSDGGIVIKMPSSKLNMILDIASIYKYLPPQTKKDNQNYLKYARREGEIICEHDVPLLINKENIAMMDINGKWTYL